MEAERVATNVPANRPEDSRLGRIEHPGHYPQFGLWSPRGFSCPKKTLLDGHVGERASLLSEFEHDGAWLRRRVMWERVRPWPDGLPDDK